MAKQKERLITILLVIAVGVLCFLLGISFGGELVPEPVEVLKIVPVEKRIIVEKEVIREVIIEKIKTVFVDKPIHTITLVSPEATDEELTRAFEAIKEGKEAHQWFVNSPRSQTRTTGDTEWNMYWVDTYKLLEDLLERAYGGIE